MLVCLSEILKSAQRKKIACGAFNITNWQTAQAVCKAAEETGKAVIMEYASVHSPFLEISDAVEIMLYFARKTKVPVAVHLDHGSSFEVCMQGIRLGFTSVMIDASTLPYEDNIRLTQDVVRAAHAANVSVEAELGRIFTLQADGSTTASGNAHKTAQTENPYTDPQAAREFVKQTKVDALAIAFGTAHGIYNTKPKLDLELVKKIRKEIKVPLVMHGGSGLTKAEFQTAIQNGISKINYYTYMSLYAAQAVKEKINKTDTASANTEQAPVFFHDISAIAVEAMKQDVKKVIEIFSETP
ncbi:class II fructose-bisphosphate aldolase [Treponema lecithinolyticum]